MRQSKWKIGVTRVAQVLGVILLIYVGGEALHWIGILTEALYLGFGLLTGAVLSGGIGKTEAARWFNYYLEKSSFWQTEVENLYVEQGILVQGIAELESERKLVESRLQRVRRRIEVLEVADAEEPKRKLDKGGPAGTTR